MPRRHDRDDDAPSWREIDKMRDSSRHTDQNRDLRGPHKNRDRYYKAQIEKAMKDKLDKVFADPEQEAAAAKIRDAVGKDERLAAATSYLDKWGVPEDFETLMALLEVKDDAIFAQAVAAMEPLWDDQPESRRKVARQTLQMRLMRVRDKDARTIAQALIRKG